MQRVYKIHIQTNRKQHTTENRLSTKTEKKKKRKDKNLTFIYRLGVLSTVDVESIHFIVKYFLFPSSSPRVFRMLKTEIKC